VQYITYIDSPAGELEIIGTDEAINAVNFVKSTRQTASESLPAIFEECIAQLNEYFEGKRRIFDFRIEQEGTDFQKRVWSELLKIPFGKTISYLELARRLGDEKVIRAAGSANGKNQLGIIVPCHRVIGADGKLVGYAGGLDKKRWLLDHEDRLANGVLTLF
jgi:methylated-DNA-[protein]-cysteine S-methyltransferase